MSPTGVIFDASFVFFSGRLAPLSNGMRVSENHRRKTYVFWSKLGSRTPDPRKCEKIQKTLKNGGQKLTPFLIQILIFFLFCWFLDEVRGVFFLRFGGQSAPNRDHFGTLLQLYDTNVGKLNTSVSPRPNTTSSSFERLGLNILGNFFQHFFWYAFWVMILRFF